MKLLWFLLPSLLWSSIVKHSDTEAYCLAQNIYFEARSSNLADKLAVSDVVLNRVASTQYPNTICGVVKQGPTVKHWKTGKPIPKRNSCQFSWYCDGKSDVPSDEDAWTEAQYIALQMLDYGSYVGISEGALFYHAHYVNPEWAQHLQFVGTIGKHKYYRIIKD